MNQIKRKYNALLEDDTILTPEPKFDWRRHEIYKKTFEEYGMDEIVDKAVDGVREYYNDIASIDVDEEFTNLKEFARSCALGTMTLLFELLNQSGGTLNSFEDYKIAQKSIATYIYYEVINDFATWRLG